MPKCSARPFRRQGARDPLPREHICALPRPAAKAYAAAPHDDLLFSCKHFLQGHSISRRRRFFKCFPRYFCGLFPETAGALRALPRPHVLAPPRTRRTPLPRKPFCGREAYNEIRNACLGAPQDGGRPRHAPNPPTEEIRCVIRTCAQETAAGAAAPAAALRAPSGTCSQRAEAAVRRPPAPVMRNTAAARGMPADAAAKARRATAPVSEAAAGRTCNAAATGAAPRCGHVRTPTMPASTRSADLTDITKNLPSREDFLFEGSYAE